MTTWHKQKIPCQWAKASMVKTHCISLLSRLDSQMQVQSTRCRECKNSFKEKIQLVLQISTCLTLNMAYRANRLTMSRFNIKIKPMLWWFKCKILNWAVSKTRGAIFIIKKRRTLMAETWEAINYLLTRKSSSNKELSQSKNRCHLLREQEQTLWTSRLSTNLPRQLISQLSHLLSLDINHQL